MSLFIKQIYPQKSNYDEPQVERLTTGEEITKNQPWHRRGWGLLKIPPIFLYPRRGDGQADSDPTEKV